MSTTFDAETRLREEREQLVHQLEELGANEKGELTGDTDFGEGFADAAAATAERTEVIGLVESLKSMLDGIDAALARIEEGTYGLCARCGNEIGAARLEFRPESVLCVDCKSKTR
ncbi:MAG: TraR/DksA C4-type zinc finger protein [Acidimicrobiia bacterium]|nr:TraR/DksA C4-type zinc finger protein [Acidimicrobiia bacterium]